MKLHAAPVLRVTPYSSAFYILLSTVALLCPRAMGQVIDPFYAADYSYVDLGSVPNLPGSYGGLTFLNGDPNTILIGGSANNLNADIFSAPVTRDSMGHITSIGPVTFFADAYGDTGGIDGGLTYGPGNVLFYTSYRDNHVGQIELGSTAPDKLIDLDSLGVLSSVGAMMFVPPGFAGAGRLKLISFNSNRWYDTTVSPDGAGTYNIAAVGTPIVITGGPEGVVYISDSNPAFDNPSILVSEWSAGIVASYEIDSNGDPIVATRRDFITDLTGAEGAAIDPITGDFLFSTFGGGDRVIRVGGFVPPPIVPEPSSIVLSFVGLLGVLIWIRRQPKIVRAGG